MHQLESFRDRAAAGEHAVIAQNHDELVAEIGDQARALVEIERDAFVVVIRKPIGELQRPLIERQQSLLLRRHRDAGDGVRVQDADGVMSAACTALWMVKPAGLMSSPSGPRRCFRRGRP